MIEDGDYSGAYYLNRSGETLTVVRAPAVDDLSNVEAGAAPEGEDTLEIDDRSDTVSGFGPGAAVGAIATALLGTGYRAAADRRDRD